MLNEIQFEVTYRSDRQDLVKDFYERCLYRSCIYRRAVGYFSSHGIASVAAGIAALAVNGGKIYLVASPNLSGEDVEAIKLGYKDRVTCMREACEREFQDIRNQLVRDRLSALAWLVARGMLDIKLAIRAGEDDPRSPSQLNDNRVKELTRYGYGGFEKLLEWFPDRPTDLESFLLTFHERINVALSPT